MGFVNASILVVACAFFTRLFYTQHVHPLANFRGPWYLSFSSAVLAAISLTVYEPAFFLYLVDKYGSEAPIRVTPDILYFPSPSALKDIYRDAAMNCKSRAYGSGILGPPSLFTTLEGKQHFALRKALSNAPWTIGPFKKIWEASINDLIRVFVKRMDEYVVQKRTICISDKVSLFALDLLATIAFGGPFGAVEKQRDEKEILKAWRNGLGSFGFATRSRTFQRILNTPKIGSYLLPQASHHTGIGWLISEADRQITDRERENSEKPFVGKPDFLQHCLDARFKDGAPLSDLEKRAHVTMLIQAGVDTTATAMGSTLRFLVTHAESLERVRSEIDAADEAGHLSELIQYDESQQHLPFFSACIKESLRLNPPATSVLPRVIPPGGKVIDGHFVPGGMEVMSYAYGVQRHKGLYGEDAEEFKPERWLESEKRAFELEAAQFAFGTGYRVCLGKDISYLEMHKLLPEIIRRYDIHLVDAGEYLVRGGLAHNTAFLVKLSARQSAG